MGMTWKIKAEFKPGKFITLVDDMVFDRERLGYWMNLSEEDWKFNDKNGYFNITVEHVRTALETLTALVEKVKSMPFTEDGAAKQYVGYDRATDTAKYEYVGSPENIAIFKEVEAVLNREYHFNFPWDEYVRNGEIEMGVPDMIEALQLVSEYAEANPQHRIIALYY